MPRHGTGGTPLAGMGGAAQRGVGDVPLHGTGDAPPHGAGDAPLRGMGGTPFRGIGSTPLQGRADAPSHGVGDALPHGAGDAPPRGMGNAPLHAKGNAPLHGKGDATLHGEADAPLRGMLDAPPGGIRGTPLRGMGYLLITATAWGLNWPVMKLLMQDWPPYAFRIFAGSGAVALLVLVALAQGDRLLPRRDQWGRLTIAAVLNVSAWSVVAPLSLFWLEASEAAIIAYTMPVWATVLAWPVLGERPTWRRVAGLVLGLSGVTLLLAGTLLAAGGGAAGGAALLAKLPGVAAILCTALMFAGGAVFTKRWPVQLAPVPLVAWQIAIGTLPVWVVALLFERLDFARVTWVGWGCLVYVAVVAQCLAYLAWFRALKALPAGTAAIGSLLVPVIGVFSSAWLLGEPLGVRHLAALVLTLGGVVLAARG